MSNNNDRRTWFSKHVDTISIVLSIIIATISSTVWINGKFSDLEKDVAVIKAVLVMKNIMPSELCKKDKKQIEK